MIDLVEGRLPLPIGGGVAVPVAPSDVDVQIENLPFWLAIDKDHPYQKQTAQFHKDQYDTAPEAGEQSLASWWTRSQMSFHAGTGLRYLDTESSQLQDSVMDRMRFHDSRGVNVWTPGVVTPLNGTSQARTAAGGERVWLETTVVNGVETLVKATPNKVETFNGTTWTTLSRGDTNSIQAFAIDGQNWYSASSTGVWKGPIAGGSATQLYNYTGGTKPLCIGWAKARLMLAVGASVYELDANVATNSALPTAKLLHPVPGWTWVAFCDTPNGVGGAGYAGLTSQVYKWEINTDSGDAVLDAGYALLTMPPGEVINSMAFYMGSMLILGSNRGIRVSTFQSYYGTITLGPLIQMVGDGVSMPITAISTYDRFIYGGTQCDGLPALMRVDLGTPLDQGGHYPWAYDLLAPVTPAPAAGALVTALTFRQDGKAWWGIQGYGVVQELSAPDPAQPAWLETGRVRLTTVEDKNWCHAYVRGLLSDDDPITVEAATPATDWTQAYVAEANGGRFDLQVPKSEWLQLRFHLSAGSELNSYAVQALPGGPRQRMIQLPLWCMDFQTTRSGMTVGYPGWALERMAALEAIETSGAEVTLAAPALFPEAVRCVIDQLSYQQDQDPGDRGIGTGGLLIVQFRTTA